MATAAEVFDEAREIQRTATARVREYAEDVAEAIAAGTYNESSNYDISRELSVPRLILELATVDTSSVTLNAALASYSVAVPPPSLAGADTRLKLPVPDEPSLEPVTIPDLVLDSLTNAAYSVFSEPDGLPTYSAGRPDLDYPEAGFIAVDDSAGLVSLQTPNLTVGQTPSFLGVAPLEYDLTEIDLLDAPEPVPPELPDITLLSNPQRMAHTIDENVVDKLIEGMQGLPVLDMSVQNLIQKQAQVVKDIQYDRAERAIVDGVAAAGFATPTGPMVDAISKLTQDTSYDDRVQYEAARDETYKRALAHVTTSLKEAIQLELANAAMHFEYASKIVETVRINVAMQIEYGNTLVGLFNQQVQVLRAKVSAYNQYVETKVSKYEAEVRATLSERVRLDTNAAKLTAYSAQIDTLQQQARAYGIEVQHETQPIEEYRAYIQGLLKNVEIVRLNIESMKEALRSYGQAVESDKAKLAAYAAQIRATGSATDVYSANWNTFSAYVQAYSAQTNAANSWAQSNLQNIRSVIGLYETQSGAHRQYEEERKQQVGRIGSLKDQYLQALGMYVQDVTRHNAAESSIDGAEDEAALIAEENATRNQLLDAQLIASQAEIDLGLATASATAQAAASQAAQSIMSYTARYAGSATASGTASEAENVTFSDNASRSYSFNTTRTA